MNVYQATEAQDVKVGDDLLVEYFDAAGMSAADHLPVVAVTLFARKVRIVCGAGWGTYTYPRTQLLTVVKPAPAPLFTDDEYRIEAISE